MATYKEIKGVTVQTKDEDPVLNVGTWSSGGSLNTARYRGGSSGTTTAGLVYTGRTPTYVANTESYNGTSWTEVNDVNNTSYAGGGSPAGSYTAALKSSGKSGPSSFQTNTEVWDGSSWTEVNNNNTGRDGIMGAGTSTSNIIAGGQTPPNQVIAESWDGTSWTEVGDLNNAKGFTTSWGSSNSNAIVATGEGDGSSPDGQGNTAETWNGSSWTATTSLNTGRTQAGAFGSTSTNGIVVAGYYGTGYQASVESFDGSAWTEVNNTANSLGLHFGSGTDNQAGFVAGGNPVPSVGTQTEEWAFPPPTASTLTEGQIFLSGGTTLKGFGKAAGIPAATWSSGGSLNTGRNGLRGAGVSQAAVVVFGGNDGSVTGKTENYNGSSWTETTDLNTAKTNSVGTGTYTAAIAAYTSTAETWDGSSWSEVSEMNTSRQEVGSLGTQTSALAIGNQNAASAIVEQWDGSSWTEVGDLTTAVGATTGFGTTSAGHAVGGGNPNAIANNQVWNGSSWSEGADMNQARYFAGASGTTTAGLVFAGYKSSPATQIANTESWNGSSFTEVNDVSTARFTGAPAHNSSSIDALLAGGNPGNSNATEEWTADNALSTVTVS